MIKRLLSTVAAIAFSAAIASSAIYLQGSQTPGPLSQVPASGAGSNVYVGSDGQINLTTGTSCRMFHSGGGPANLATSSFTNQTPVATEVYIAEVYVPTPCVATGVATYNGSVASGNVKAGLANAAGAVVATSASTASSGTTAYQNVPFTGTLNLTPGTYYILTFYDNTTVRPTAWTAGAFGASKQTGQTFATGFTTITPPTTFTTALGPVASLY